MKIKNIVLAGIFLLFGAFSSSSAAFNPEGWDSNNNFPLIGSPKAKKGGEFKYFWTNFPPTLRTEGPNSNFVPNNEVQSLMYESLVGLHPTTLEYIPGLANYWKISADKRKFSFHVNPKAAWADGSPVTAEDVVATWEFRIREDIKDPYSVMMWGGSFEKPVAESKYVVSVKTKELNWRLFLYFGNMAIYPAKEIKGLTGDKYLKDYNWKMWMGSGPYELKPETIVKENSLFVTRRKDYWAEKERANIGLNNFDKISWKVILDEELAFEKFKKGEIDYYVVGKAQRWIEECDFDKIKKGWIQKRKIFTQEPKGHGGFVFNMRKPPFNNRNVRKAFSFLFNRERLIDKLFFNEYDYIDSYYPGGDWGNSDNPKIRYNPRRAARLLKRAGWTNRNKDGWLVNKDGEIFELTLEYGQQGSTRIHKVIKEEIEKAGIKFNLKLIDSRTLMKKVSERKFTIHFQSWRATLFPNPKSSWNSELAGAHTNNLPGFKNKGVDELCKKYNVTFDRAEQKKIIGEIDGIIFRVHPYALGWYGNNSRVLYENKFGHPKEYFSKIGDYNDIKTFWWYDRAKEKALSEAIKSNKSLPIGKTIQKPWK
ncbi:MAG: ABC transporter substrate-binding protein [Elusimicrobiales bacterium]|nr:ABC transporter substrate-binding protein [Elusimicrobiales bacterium]